MKKRFLILLAWIISFSFMSCSNSDSGESLELINESAIEVETELVVEPTLDPLVEYALSNIDFQFVSDTGYYVDYNDISITNYSNQAMINDIKYLGTLIEQQNFSGLREQILDIPDYNNLIKEVKINYIVPTLMHENNYLDALRIIYKKEEIEMEKNRFLFDIIYLMRYMYVNNGLEYAVEVVDQLKEEFPTENVSYVWFAISPRQYDDLTDTGFVYPPKEESDRNELWHYLVLNYSDDPHIDYAHYFLGDYEKIIDDHPESMLIEKAFYARANKLYGLILEVIYNDSDKLDRVDLALTKDYYEKYIMTYPDSKYTYRAVSDVTYLCRMMLKTYGEGDHYFDFVNAILPIKYSENYYKKKDIAKRILYSAKSNYTYSKKIIDMSKSALEFLNDENVDSSFKSYIWSGLANNAFYKGELELAVEYFDNIEKEKLDRFDLYRLIVLSEIKPFLGETDVDSLFKKAEILRDHGEYFASVYIYNKLIKLEASDEDLSKAYMLRASSSRKNREYDEMLVSYEYIVNNLDKTDFADDALAEIGVHYLLTKEDYKKSREIFREVIRKYPDRNAVNNSYNWIAWSYLQEKDYVNALEAYEELKEKLPTNRFGRNAIPNIKKIKEKLNEE